MTKAVFLDRDGTLNIDYSFINHPDHIQLYDDVVDALLLLQKNDFKLIIVTNQSGLGRGLISSEELAEVHEILIHILESMGVYIERIYHNAVVPEDDIIYNREQERKPGAGMLLKAADELGIDLKNSYMIGDREGDIGAGQQAGCKTILVNRNGNEYVSKKYHPDVIVDDLHAAAQWILQR